jgi:peptide-methionine (S)-S-oxide reductase
MKHSSPFLLIIAMFFAFSSCAQKTRTSIEANGNTNHNNMSKLSQATFAAGCFWHEEALFESVKGVKEAISGYAGGSTKNPSYESIETGSTGHAETVNVYYDSSVISYPTLLKIYFAGQDPTQVNGQGPDLGTQYRSLVLYRNNDEKKMAEQFIKDLNASGKYNKPIAVKVAPMVKFWPAEDYHQDYIKHNPDGGYVQNVSIPEIRHFQKQYPELIKPDHKF